MTWVQPSRAKPFLKCLGCLEVLARDEFATVRARHCKACAKAASVRECKRCEAVVPLSSFAKHGLLCAACRTDSLKRRKLPVGPLVRAMEKQIRRESAGNPYDLVSRETSADNTHEWVCERCGITSRTFLRWRTGEIKEAHFDRVDAVLVGLDLLWWDVFEDGEEYALAEQMFTGDMIEDDVLELAA